METTTYSSDLYADLIGASNERVLAGANLFSDMKKISGLSTKELSQKLGYPVKQVESWVSQKEYPPLSVILNMKKLIKRPLVFIATPDDFVERSIRYLDSIS